MRLRSDPVCRVRLRSDPVWVAVRVAVCVRVCVTCLGHSAECLKGLFTPRTRCRGGVHARDGGGKATTRRRRVGVPRHAFVKVKDLAFGLEV